jgi:hypothetical protein
MQSDGDERMLKKRRESNRLCAQRRRARQKRQIEELQEEAFGLALDNERLRTENKRLRGLVQEELLVSQELRQRSVATPLPYASQRSNFPSSMPNTPRTNLPYPFNIPLGLDEFINVPRPSLLPILPSTVAQSRRDLPTLISTLGVPGTSQSLLLRHALGRSSLLNDGAQFSMPSAPPGSAAAVGKERKATSKGRKLKKRRGRHGISSDDDSSDES